MKVTLDVSAVPQHLAGAGRYVAEITRRLPQNDVDTTLVTRVNDLDRWREISPRAMVSALVPAGRAQRLAYEALLLGTSGPAKNADVWHAPHYTMPRRGRTPTVVTIHDLTFFTNPEWHESSKVAFFRRAIKYSAKHADVLLSVSEFTARQIDEFIPNHAPVVVAPHGVDLQRFTLDTSHDRALFEKHGLSTDTPYVFFLGTFEPRKGIDVLLEAFGRLAEENPDLELWLAGQSGWGVSGVEERLVTHPAASRIKRLGFVDEEVLPSLLRQARCVAYPSRGEGFGLPVLEALACGAPVVTSRDTVMAEVSGTTALLTTPGNAEELADAIAEVIGQSDEERQAGARVSRQRAELYTWDFSLTRHLDAYQLAKK
jgi:glycosyltransferase involved in cell wall biosynthesis